MNIRHDLDPVLVREQIEKKILEYEEMRVRLKASAALNLESYERTPHLWTRAPSTTEDIDSMINDWIIREREYYALVRVIEVPGTGNRFLLVYGDDIVTIDDIDDNGDNGTGPFETLECAAGWFFHSGR